MPSNPIVPARIHSSATVTPGSRRRGPRAFTVTELLVVIAIIAVLVGLLLAALNAARQRSQASATQATMEAFRAGCEAFLQAQGQLPGAIPEATLISDAAANGGVPKISSMENAILHLMGGFALSSTAANPTGDPFFDGFTGPAVIELSFTQPGPGGGTLRMRVDPNRIGEGPRIGGKQFEPYFTPTPGTLLPVSGQAIGDDDDPLIPDLVDAWGQPIGFMRRIRPLGPLVRFAGANEAAQFDPTGLLPYVLSSELGRKGRDQRFSAGNPDGSVLTGLDSNTQTARDNLARLIQNPAFDDQARGTFVLFSAGPDGVYFAGSDGPGTVTEPVVDLLLDDLPTDIAVEYDDLLSFGGS
jgi:prepilin-type N-terminal cleavage/methylation domain-containing protein